MQNSRWLTQVVIVALAVAGPLAPWTALAQSSPQQGQNRMLNNPRPPTEPTMGHRVGAVFANVIHVPGKAVLCGVGVGLSATLMLITLGSGYRDGVRAFEEGCGGAWVLTPEHLSGKARYSSD